MQGVGQHFLYNSLGVNYLTTWGSLFNLYASNEKKKKKKLRNRADILTTARMEDCCYRATRLLASINEWGKFIIGIVIPRIREILQLG